MDDLLQNVGKGGKNADHIAAARNIWKALDDMAEANPEQYNEFIKQQMEQAHDLGMVKPASHPGVILTASVASSSGSKAAVISLFESEQCSQPTVRGKPWNKSSAQLPSMRIEFRVRTFPLSSSA
jgi:hypothetical protein